MKGEVYLLTCLRQSRRHQQAGQREKTLVRSHPLPHHLKEPFPHGSNSEARAERDLQQLQRTSKPRMTKNFSTAEYPTNTPYLAPTIKVNYTEYMIKE